jgi:hypothetical protein
MRLFLALMFLVLVPPVQSQEAPSAEVLAIGKTLDFVADVSKYQGMFDSVVAFCRPHAPDHIVKLAQDSWLSANQKYLDLRDSELSRVIENSRKTGAEPSRITFIKHWAEQQYQGALKNDRMYKDLLGRDDLPISCAQRLGVMNSAGMRIEIIAPRAVEYAEGSIGGP